MTPAWLDWPETRTLIKAFASKPESLRFVGGAVRDALLKIPVEDIDAATTLEPQAVMALLTAERIKVIPTGIDHGTVTAVIDQKSFEITTLRKDVETFGRHATIKYTGDWQQDALRRDFTINALYLSPEGALFDYFGGEADLKAGRVRFIGKAEERIREDYLRILRFFRFYGRFGTGAPDAAALAACNDAAPHIAGLSGERIQTEMMKLLAAQKPSVALSPMQGGIARQVFGLDISLDVVEALERIEEEQAIAPQAMTRLAALLLPSPKMATVLVQAWKLSNADGRRLQKLLAHIREMDSKLPLPAQKKLLRETGAGLFRQLVTLRWAMDGAAAEKAYLPMLELADSWELPTFPLSGEDLKAIGMIEGKSLGEVLKRLEELWEASDYQLTREQLLIKAKMN